MSSHALPRNPYIAGKALNDDAIFSGREDVLNFVKTTLLSSNQNAIVLFGQRRIGKTSIMLRLCKLLPSPPLYPVYFDLMDCARKPLSTVLYELASTIATEFNLTRPKLDDFTTEGENFKERFLPTLYKALGDQARPIFLFDEFDVLDVAAEDKLDPNAAARAFFPYLRRLIESEPRLGFIFVVGRKPEELSIDVKSTFKTTRYQRISVLDDNSACHLITLAEREGSLHFTKPAIDRILKLTAGHPYFIQLLCQLLFDQAYTVSTSDIPAIDITDVDVIIPKVLEAGENIFVWIWEGLPPAERVIFSAIASGTTENTVITEDDLTDILQKNGIRMLIRELELAPKTLVEWQMLRQKNNGFTFFIEVMRRWVVERKPLPKVKEELDRVNPIADQHYQLGYTYYRQGSLQEAAKSLQAALQSNPLHLKARLLLGGLLREQGDITESIKQLEEAYRYDESAAKYPLVRALLVRGDMAEKQGRNEDALATYERILEISSREAVARERSQAILIAQGDKALGAQDFTGALSAYRKAGANQKVVEVENILHKQELETFSAQLDALRQHGEWDKIVEVYQRLIELDSKDKRWRQGLEDAQKEQLLSRRYAEGLGAMQQKRWTEAQRAFADIIYKQPDYREAATNLAKIVEMSQATVESKRVEPQVAELSQNEPKKETPILKPSDLNLQTLKSQISISPKETQLLSIAQSQSETKSNVSSVRFTKQNIRTIYRIVCILTISVTFMGFVGYLIEKYAPQTVIELWLFINITTSWQISVLSGILGVWVGLYTCGTLNEKNLYSDDLLKDGIAWLGSSIFMTIFLELFAITGIFIAILLGLLTHWIFSSKAGFVIVYGLLNLIGIVMVLAQLGPISKLFKHEPI